MPRVRRHVAAERKAIQAQGRVFASLSQQPQWVRTEAVAAWTEKDVLQTRTRA